MIRLMYLDLNYKEWRFYGVFERDEIEHLAIELSVQKVTQVKYELDGLFVVFNNGKKV